MRACVISVCGCIDHCGLKVCGSVLGRQSAELRNILVVGLVFDETAGFSSEVFPLCTTKWRNVQCRCEYVEGLLRPRFAECSVAIIFLIPSRADENVLIWL